ncbi:MAG: ATP-dependent helicase HrpB [Planctomycetota bacterium]|nr:MAG: ATP-dependent helicase HrpB [Planctomycetota bacterium]
MKPLPIDDVLPQLVEALRSSPCVVLKAPTGAGKTTRVPPALRDAGLVGDQELVMLEPRRLATRTAARRIAHERGGRVGDEVGYRVRFDDQTSSATRIAVVTDGVFLRRLQADPFLDGIGIVLFDEFHERNLNTDLALAMTRRVQQTVRPDLQIVVMSATLQVEPIAAFLGNCPIVESQGRTFPVDIQYARIRDRPPIQELAVTGIEQLLPRTPGDLLVFLPGVPEIRRTERLLEPLAHRQGLAVMTLYGDMPAEDQDRVLLPGSQRKVVLATNVAETSVTIEGITGVVDTGWAKVMRFDPQVGLDQLELSPISRASADQRAGRAGRTQPGVCLRMWDESSHRARPEVDDPEIRRVDLAGPVLELLCWGETDVAAFPWFEPPREAALTQALHLLRKLGALDEQSRVTPIGRAMSSLPVQPRLGRLLVEGHALGAVEDAVAMAALLSERNPFFHPSGAGSGRGPIPTASIHKSRSDVLDRVQALRDYFQTGRRDFPLGSINSGAADFIRRTAEQLDDALHAELGRSSAIVIDREESASLALLAGFPDRLAKRRDSASDKGIMVGGKGVKLAPQSAVSSGELFLCLDVDGGSTDALVRMATVIEKDWLPRERLRTGDEVFFHPTQQQVVARRRTAWDDLVLAETPCALPEDERPAEVLFDAAAKSWDRVFPSDQPEVTGFLTRVRCLHEWLPEIDLPPLDDEALRQVLRSLCDRCRSFAQLKQAPWLDELRGRFDYVQLQRIEREAPDRLTMPGGKSIRLTYEAGRPPVLAVRIQDAFGLRETPRIAGGRVRVLMHLLAPNMRPQQVTDDLASFWATTYAMVRKELARRYPKHAWPETP